MTRFPVLSKFLRKEMLAIAVETAAALRDGTYWGTTTIYDERNFPDPPDLGGFSGGDGD
jgi:hypothetical protein